jgi:hypothetical protein
MATTKITTQATPLKTRKTRQRRKALIASAATEVSAGAEVAPAQAAQTSAEPDVAAASAPTPGEPTLAEATAESSASVSAMPAEESTTATAAKPPEATAPAQKLSALDAAANVLEETGKAMSCPELITAMAARGYWQSPKGRTPASTLYSALLRELQTKGEQSWFVKVERGKFAVRGTVS